MKQMRDDLPTEEVGGYGYQSDEQEVVKIPFKFGGNFGVTFLTKFEYIVNGGKDGAEGEALDIIFNINGTDKSYRQFPITKAFGKNQEEITDPTAQEFRDAQANLSQVITHILRAFLDEEAIKASMAGKVMRTFKDYAQHMQSLLPKDFNLKPLDIFVQYQWQLRGDQKKTFLEIPNKMKYGKWLSPAQPGTWTEKRVENPKEDDPKALFYVNEQGVEHPYFVKNGWFMTSNFATQQKVGGNSNSNSSNAAPAGSAPTINQGNKPASGW